MVVGAKALVFEGWKSLDFLGLSRHNLDLSMCYAGFSLKEKSRAMAGRRETRHRF
jgi:hypothetical protein